MIEIYLHSSVFHGVLFSNRKFSMHVSSYFSNAISAGFNMSILLLRRGLTEVVSGAVATETDRQTDIHNCLLIHLYSSTITITNTVKKKDLSVN